MFKKIIIFFICLPITCTANTEIIQKAAYDLGADFYQNNTNIIISKKTKKVNIDMKSKILSCDKGIIYPYNPESDIFLKEYFGKSDNKNKVIYITFDDGPTHNTPLILDTLKKHNQHATFFLLEKQMRDYPHLVNRILNEGHSVGLHGVSHIASVIYSSNKSVVAEMDETNKTLHQITGCKTSLVRTPFGSSYMTQAQKDALKENNYNCVDWNVDPRDSISGNSPPSPYLLTSRVLKQSKKQKEPVVLLHDRLSTLHALDTLLSTLDKEKYKSLPLPENYTISF